MFKWKLNFKNIYTARANIQNMEKQMSGPDSSNG